MCTFGSWILRGRVNLCSLSVNTRNSNWSMTSIWMKTFTSLFYSPSYSFFINRSLTVVFKKTVWEKSHSCLWNGMGGWGNDEGESTSTRSTPSTNPLSLSITYFWTTQWKISSFSPQNFFNSLLLHQDLVIFRTVGPRPTTYCRHLVISAYLLYRDGKWVSLVPLVPIPDTIQLWITFIAYFFLEISNCFYPWAQYRK